MGFKLSHLYAAPAVNPANSKARSIPFLNPFNLYGRVFFFSWFGFMIGFWAWYTFPPLLTHTIKHDLHLSSREVANSNIISMCATLLVRLASGPLCDRFGPRNLFGALLLLGSIPLGLAPLVRNATGLYVSRFFIGILGGVFVPSQVWCMGFFDDNVVGTVSGLTGGFGVAGGGITYLIMPAVYDALVAGGHTPSKAWRFTFLVPLAMVLTVAVALLVLCPDAPTGRWRDRHMVQGARDNNGGFPKGGGGCEECGDSSERTSTDTPGGTTTTTTTTTTKSQLSSPLQSKEKLPATTTTITANDNTAPTPSSPSPSTPTTQQPPPTPHAPILSPQTLFHGLSYFSTFGSELAINAVLASFYSKTFPSLTQTTAANYAAMFGFLDFVARPMGGVISDLLYRFACSRSSASSASSSSLSSALSSSSSSSSAEKVEAAIPTCAREGRMLWYKKLWVTFCTLAAGAVLVVVGRAYPPAAAGSGNNKSEAGAIALIALAAVFLQAGSGANYSLLPHVPDPRQVGALAGVTGAAGNLGGVVFSIVFRFMDGGEGYAKGFWVIGIVNMALGVGLGWIPPLPAAKLKRCS
ncbi:hypothetical protein VTJ04DRAFT_3331 [Mycothermus thermophilus]|uniref:uncharacterized protein n=1 Tax=Humicola insolens TaxID=85995 RepID=UPI0037434786